MKDQLTELRQCIAMMNDDGLDRLVTLAKDITSNKNFRRTDSGVQISRFDRQTYEVLALVNRAYLASSGQIERQAV